MTIEERITKLERTNRKLKGVLNERRECTRNR